MMKRALTAEQRRIQDRNKGIIATYVAAHTTTERIAKIYGVSVKRVQVICKQAGVIRTNGESNRLMAKYKDYSGHRVPAHLKAKRKQITLKRRVRIISKQPWCTLCGAKVTDGIRLEVDHKDNDATNNEITNLQVLCNRCNLGKSHLDRYGDA